MNPEANRRLVRRYFDLMSGIDLSTADEILSPEVVFFGPRAPEGIRGRAALIQFVVGLRRESPDFRFVEGETVTEGDRVASVFTMTRMHRNEEGQTREIVTEGIDLFRVADERSTALTPTSTGSACWWRWESSSRRLKCERSGGRSRLGSSAVATPPVWVGQQTADTCSWRGTD
jgi:ketosteroid isomerase-like protein